MKGLVCGWAVMLGLALAPVLVVATPAGQASSSVMPVTEISGPVRAAEVRPLFADVPAGGYPDHFPFGQCTWWAAFNVHVTWWGDAGAWLADARTAGRPTSPVPLVHSIVVYGPSPGYSQWGHVAVVIAVGPTSFQVSEMNYADGGRGTGAVDERASPWPDGLVEGFILPDR